MGPQRASVNHKEKLTAKMTVKTETAINAPDIFSQDVLINLSAFLTSNCPFSCNFNSLSTPLSGYLTISPPNGWRVKINIFFHSNYRLLCLSFFQFSKSCFFQQPRCPYFHTTEGSLVVLKDAPRQYVIGHNSYTDSFVWFRHKRYI